MGQRSTVEVLAVWVRAANADRNCSIRLEELRRFHVTFDAATIVVELASRTRYEQNALVQ
jgi:hypothetical protein